MQARYVEAVSIGLANKAAMHMRMPEESHLLTRMPHSGFSFVFMNDVAILVIGCAVNHIEMFNQHRTAIEMEQPL